MPRVLFDAPRLLMPLPLCYDAASAPLMLPSLLPLSLFAFA